MKDEQEWIHALLDAGESAASGTRSTAEQKQLDTYRSVLAQLEEPKEHAPEGFTAAVMAALPDHPERRWVDRLRALWPARGRWAVPALAGALATLVLAVGLVLFQQSSTEGLVPVTFEVHAPGAQRVEVVGTFNDWRPGQVLLKGPDATGHWSGTVRLPAGRHEYAYLLDGQEWLTDPEAPARRPDGFGRENAVIQI